MAKGRVRPTLARGIVRIPYRMLGRRAFALHDWIVARRLRKLAGQVDIVHTWPLGALRTLKVAAQMGIPTVLERPSAHTRFVYEAIQREHERLALPYGQREEFTPRDDVLALEEEEFDLADYLLCPSDFVVQTFLQRGFRRRNCFDISMGMTKQSTIQTRPRARVGRGLKVLFVGYSALYKGLALRARGVAQVSRSLLGFLCDCRHIHGRVR